jgi:hypothetical protein
MRLVGQVPLPESISGFVKGDLEEGRLLGRLIQGPKEGSGRLYQSHLKRKGRVGTSDPTGKTPKESPCGMSS